MPLFPFQWLFHFTFFLTSGILRPLGSQVRVWTYEPTRCVPVHQDRSRNCLTSSSSGHSHPLPHPCSCQVTAPWATLFALLSLATYLPGVWLRVEPSRVPQALLLVSLVSLLALVVPLATDLSTRRSFIKAEQQASRQR